MTSIFYITRLSFMTTRAHVYNIAKTAEAINDSDKIKLTLVSTDNALIEQSNKVKFFAVNNIKNKFDIISLNSFSNYLWSSKNLFLKRLSFIFANFSLIKLVFKKRKVIDVIYFRDYFILPAALFSKYFLRKKVFYESHATIKNNLGQKLVSWCIRISNGVITITEQLSKVYSKMNKNIITVFCASSEVERFDFDINKEKLRLNLEIPSDKIIIGYIGNMGLTGNYEQYRIDRIIESLSYLPQNYCFVGVGDKNNESRELIKKAKRLGILDRVIIFPWQSRETVVKYLLSFDILVIPYSGSDPGDSPTKMFEYLATKKPIVALETPPVAEVLYHEKNAILIKNDQPQIWAKAISRIITDKELNAKITAQAFADAKKYTWPKRGEIISDFINQLIKI